MKQAYKSVFLLLYNDITCFDKYFTFISRLITFRIVVVSALDRSFLISDIFLFSSLSFELIIVLELNARYV